MAEFNGPEKTPNVGIRGNAQNLPVLKPRESLQPTTAIPNFSNALTELALTPTALGQLASKVDQSFSIAIAQQKGLSLGKNPNGNLLPPITDFDKALVDSYTSQAQVTLGLQAQQMMADAQTQLNKSNRLSPGLIDNYAKSMTAGMQDILALAPDNIKPAMQNQFASQIINSTAQLNNKLISQNKTDAASKDAVWRIHQTDQISNAVKDGNFELAKQMYESLQTNIESAYKANNLTAVESDAAKTSAKLSYESAKAIQQALSSKDSGTLEPYLESLAAKKIPGLSWSESEQVRNNTVSYINSVESAENRNQSVIYSRGQQDIQNGTFADKAPTYKDQLRPLQYQQLMTSFSSQQMKTTKANIEVNHILKDPSNPEIYAGLSGKIINQAYDKGVADRLQQAQLDGNEMSTEEAQFQTAANMGVAVPKFIDMINKDLQSGNAMLMLKGMEFSERLRTMQGEKTQGIDSKSLAMAQVFEDLLASSDGSPQEAAARAKDIIFNKDETILKLNNSGIAESMNNMVRDSAHVLSAAVKLSGIDDGSPIQNEAAFSADVFNRFKGYMHLTNRNERQSKILTQKDIAKIYDTTYVNGYKQTAKLPIEKVVNLGEGSTPLIQVDVMHQLEPQLNETKRAYDNGTSEFYWRIKPRTSFEDYAAAKLKIREEGLQDKDYAQNHQLVKEFEKALPIEVEQVFRNKTTHSYQLDVSASPYAQFSNVEGQVLGGFDIGIKDPQTGIISAMHGYYGATQTLPEYRPNTKWIRDNYISVNGIQGLTDEQYLGRIGSRRETNQRLLSSRKKLLTKIVAGDIQ